MNKNKVIGFAFVVAALAMIGICASSGGDFATNYIGKAVWYFPYASLVAGIARLVHT